MRTSDKSEAWKSGYQAQTRGSKASDNPFHGAGKPTLCLAWFEGFASSEREVYVPTAEEWPQATA